jgi:TRAP-type C4-dicarboxylate transport system permease small subunit
VPENDRRARGPLAFALRVLGFVELAVCAGAFLFTCIIVSTNVLLRYGFNSSLVWSEEVALLSTNIFVFLGAAVILKAKADVSVTFVVGKLSPRAAAYLEFLTYAAAAIFFATMLVQAIALWPLQRNTTTFILDISRFWFTLPLVWASASMLLTSIAFAADVLKSIRRRRHDVVCAPYLPMPVEPE